MPFPTKLPPADMSFEDMLVYAASEMPFGERLRYIGALEDEIGRSHTLPMIRAVDRLKRGEVIEANWVPPRVTLRMGDTVRQFA